MDKTINTNTNANANTNTNIKQPKEFEEEIKFNPEFIGLFRNELLRCELKDDNNNISSGTRVGQGATFSKVFYYYMVPLHSKW